LATGVDKYEPLFFYYVPRKKWGTMDPGFRFAPRARIPQQLQCHRLKTSLGVPDAESRRFLKLQRLQVMKIQPAVGNKVERCRVALSRAFDRDIEFLGLHSPRPIRHTEYLARVAEGLLLTPPPLLTTIPKTSSAVPGGEMGS